MGVSAYPFTMAEYEVIQEQMMAAQQAAASTTEGEEGELEDEVVETLEVGE